MKEAMSTKPYEPTEAEQLAIGHAMIRAALDSFGQFPPKTEDEDQDEIARRVVHALVAAGAVRDAEQLRLRDLVECPSIDTDPHEAMATAFWMWSEGIKMKVTDAAPSSVIGSRLLGFAQGLAAARAMAEALDLLQEGSMFAFCHRGAAHLAKNLPE